MTPATAVIIGQPRPRCARSISTFGIFATTMLAASTALGQGRPDLIHNEKPGDPPGHVDKPPSAPGGVAGNPTVGPYVSIQANVDANGNNIPGDAGNEPSIAVNPFAPNQIVIGWRQFDTTASNFRQAGWGWSNDGGRTWNFDGQIIEPGIFRSDPVLDVDPDGNFQYLSLTDDNGDFICQLFTSTDGGQSWDGGVQAYGGDKQWFITDRTGTQGNGHSYETWVWLFTPFDGFFTRRSTGPFELPLTSPINLFWGTLAVNSDGILYLSGVDLSFEPQLIRSSNARDSGTIPTFDLVSSVPMGGDIVQGGTPNPGGLLGQVWVAVDTSGGPFDGNIYMCCSLDPPGSDPMNVQFARSENGGSTWSSPVKVNDDPNGSGRWQWFGTMSIAPNGRLDIIWNDTRNGSSTQSELFYSTSSDAGVTWSANVALSPQWNSIIGWPNQDKIGDYYHMISDNVGAHVAYSATHNGEQDVYYLRIGDYDCNGNGIAVTDDATHASDDCNDNGIPDECEIAAGAAIDDNGNGIIDECESDCVEDLSGNGTVNAKDLAMLLGAWGSNPGGPPDFNGNGNVGPEDLAVLLGAWGPC